MPFDLLLTCIEERFNLIRRDSGSQGELAKIRAHRGSTSIPTEVGSLGIDEDGYVFLPCCCDDGLAYRA